MLRTTTHLRAVMLAITICIPPCSALQAADDFSITTDHIYGHKAGMALTFDVVSPTKGANGIGLLYMVSQGWVSNYFDLDQAMKTSKQRNGRFSSLTDRGYTLFMVRHGSAPYFKVPDAVADVRLALRYIRLHAGDWHVDPDRLGVFGNSAGGHLALMLGTTSDSGNQESEDAIERTPARVAAVVAYYPPVDLREAAAENKASLNAALSKLQSGPLGFDASLQESVSPIVHVSHDDAPTLLIHGDKDISVPLENSIRMHNAFQNETVRTELIVMEGAGHAFPGVYGSRAAIALADWFDSNLLNRSKP